MLESVARWFEVDTATSKVTCIDLMRANPFDVVIASERLSDGSGLELLSHVATRWPDTLRVLVIEPARLRLLKGKLAPFRLHATMRYPIEEDELETVLNRMGELLETDEAPAAEEAPIPEPPRAPPAVTTKVQKVTLPQSTAKSSSANTRSAMQAAPERPAGSASRTPAHSSGDSARARPSAANASSASLAPARPPGSSSIATPSKPTSRSVKTAAPLGAPMPPAPPPIRRKLGNYTPLGAPEDSQMRIVEREFDRTVAPLAARAIRAREEASRPRSQKEKLGTLTTSLRDTLKRLLKR